MQTTSPRSCHPRETGQGAPEGSARRNQLRGGLRRVSHSFGGVHFRKTCVSPKVLQMGQHSHRVGSAARHRAGPLLPNGTPPPVPEGVNGAFHASKDGTLWLFQRRWETLCDAFHSRL